MKYQLQEASANDTGRYDSTESVLWQTIAEADNPEAILLDLITLCNDEYSFTNSWLRLVVGTEVEIINV